jgi:hypothetical protein
MKIIKPLSLFGALAAVLCIPLSAFAAAGDASWSCGEGYLTAAKGKLDGVEQYECQKLWCRDLENGKSMGSGERASGGYKATPEPVELCDASGKCVSCFGDRKWCAGEAAGAWNPEYGAYTKNGADSNAYLAAQKGDCYAWQMQKPVCRNEGEVAVIEGGEWVCAVSEGNTQGVRASGIRRSGGVKRR